MELVVELKEEFLFKSSLLLSNSSSKDGSSAFEANFSTFVHLKQQKIRKLFQIVLKFIFVAQVSPDKVDPRQKVTYSFQLFGGQF